MTEKQDCQEELPERPVLTYHLIDPALDDQNSVSPALFAQQIDALLDEGFKFQRIDSCPAGTCEAQKERSLILSFDDGYASTLEYAHPFLVTRGVPYVLFVPTDYIGQTNIWNHKARYIRSHLTWDELRALQSAGVTIGSHGCSHHSLVKLSACDLRTELARSKAILEDKLGVAVKYVAYPYGDVSTPVESVASEYYSLGFSVHQGGWSWTNRPWAINRFLMGPYDRPDAIRKRLIGRNANHQGAQV